MYFNAILNKGGTMPKAKKRISKKSTPKRNANPVGRPTKYKPEYCQQIIDFMSQGKSMERFAVSIDVMPDTILNWTKEHEEFLGAYKKAKFLCQALWEEMCLKGMNERDFKPAVWIFWMKARHGWRETQDINVNVETPETKYDLDKMSPEDYKAMILSAVNKNNEK